MVPPKHLRTSAERTAGSNSNSPAFLLNSGKLVDRRLVICLSWFQLGGRKLGLVGRIRKVLRLQAECGPARDSFAPLPANRAIQEVAGIKLDTRDRKSTRL